MQSITNAIQSFVILLGDKAIDESKLEKFIKKFTNISVEIRFDSVRKQSQIGFRPGIKMATKFQYYVNKNNDAEV